MVQLTHKTLVIDFGQKRIGYALLNPEIQMVIPGKTIHNDHKLKQVLLDLVGEQQIKQIVVGLPLNLKGEHTLSTRAAIAFSVSIKDWTGLPVWMVDERMTTQASMRKAQQFGGNEKKVRPVVDAMSASEIAQSYMINPNLGIPLHTILCARGSIG